MRTVTYLAGAAVLVAVVGGAVLVQRSTAETSAPAGQEGSTVTSSHDPVPNDEFGVEDDYDVSLEDPVIEGGEPTTWEEFARDAAVGQHPDAQPIDGGRAIFEGEVEPPR